MNAKNIKASQKMKKTPIGDIPVDWGIIRLENVITDIGDGGTPDRKNNEYFNGNIPWATVGDINFRIISTKENITKLGLKESSAKLWPPKTVILTTGATIGKVGLADFPLATKQGITGIVCNEKYVIPEYLARYFESKVKYLNRMAHGSTFKEIRAPLLKKLEFPLPPVSEQHKIAEILGSVDKVIEKTQAVIDQTEIIKKGLMQELLTRGIPGRHQKFKTTEIGEIPEEWEVKKIKDCVSINPDQLGISTDEEMIIKYLDISGIEKTGVIGEFKDYLFKEAPCRARRKVQKGDIIISTVRPYLRAFACLRNCPDNLIVSTGFAVLRSNKIEDIEFIYQNILYNKFVDSLIDKMTGSNYPAVSSGDIGEYKIAYPNNIKEKELISNILNVIDNNLKYETIIMEKIGILKSALMQVLLTGKVRVKI